MAITEQGLTIRRFPEVEEDIQDSLLENLNTSLVFDSDTLIGQLIAIIGAEIADEEALIQAVYDSFDIDKAEGAALERLVALIGLARLSAATTTGDQEFVGSDGTLIPAGSLVSNPSTQDQFETLVELTLAPASCQSVTYTVSTVLDNENYTISVNGLDFLFTSDGSATAAEIVDGLAAQINLPAGRTWEAENVSDQLRVFTLDNNNIVVSAITFLLVDFVVAEVAVQSVVTGEIRAPANVITNIVSSIAGIISTNNNLSFSTGRDRETDEGLRERASESTQLAGSSTVPANLSTVSNVAGVNTVLIVENLSAVVDSEGRPPHSYEVIVDGGVEGDIAAAIFSEKPAGIQTFGDITINIIDASDTPRAISFSRPTNVFIAVRVTFNLYDEEVFPVTGTEDIEQAVLDTGNALDIGEDVINGRFVGPIYASAEGINTVLVETQIISSSGTTPGTTSGSITSVTNSGGVARFNHSGTDPSIGEFITVSGFVTETTYNTAAAVSLSGAGFFELTGVSFTGDETGIFESWSEVKISISNSEVSAFNALDIFSIQT